MKNLMSRNEYLQNVEEGFIKDTVKKGWEMIKSVFKIGLKKIKDFITVFDKNGDVLPVVSPQAIIDKFSNSSVVKVFASPAMNETVIDAGGNGCSESPSHSDSDEIYNYGPDGKEFFNWMGDKKYEESLEYKNLMSIPNIIQEWYDGLDDDRKKLFESMADDLDESWEGIVKARVPYIDKKTADGRGGEISGVDQIDTEEFADIIKRLIKDWSVRQGKTIVRASDGKVSKPLRNVLVFGAPGIGKSTIPNMIVDEYNASASGPDKMISIININCADIEEGDFMMPTMPKEIDVVDNLKKFSDAFPYASDYIQGLSAERTADIEKVIQNSGQFKSSDAPKSWLPSYKKTGDDAVDTLLDISANGGVYTDKSGKTEKTGGGGIIVFDEFLRAKPGVFGQLMNFLLVRELNGWVLGSKWAIIACTNRPCDDGQVAGVWKNWNDSPAAKDRFSKFFQLIPDPESWKKWARSKGCDELIIDFIFEKNSMSGDEYPRWHSTVRKGTGDAYQVKPITPRAWEEAFCEIGRFEIEHDLSDISEMTDKEITRCLKGSFDPDFCAEVVTWLRDRMDKIDLDGIMSKPKEIYLPMKFVNDPDKALILIQNLTKEFVDRFGENPGDCSDEQLANIFIWLGMNYKGDMVAVQNFLEDIIKDVFKNNGDYMWNKYIKAQQVLFAAYPMRDIEDDVADAEDPNQKYPWPENSMETIKDIMREYFPWRISGDKIKYYDDLDLSDDKKKKEE